MTLIIPGENFVVPETWPAGTWGMMTSIGVAVANLHWKADPAKRNDPDWFPTNTKGLSVRQIAREFNLDWTIADGKPVFPDYSKEKHTAPCVLTAERGLTVFVGWDFGLNPAAVFNQVSDLGQVRVLRALNEENKALVTFGPIVLKTMLDLNAEAGFDRWTYDGMLAHFQKLWKAAIAAETDFSRERMLALEQEVSRQVYEDVFSEGLEFIHVGDPAGKSRTGNDAVSGYQYLKTNYGIRVKGNQKHQVWDTRRNAVTNLLVAEDVAPDTPKFLISPHPSTERLRAGFEGSYAYAESADTGGRELPLKDRFSHPQDGLQYVACHLFPAKAAGPAGGAVVKDYTQAATGKPSTLPKPPETRWEALETGESTQEADAPSVAPKPPARPVSQAWLQSMMP